MTNPSQTSTSFKGISLPDAPPASRRKGHGRATLRDVASQAGVTTMTVSRYLRSPDKVAQETAHRVQNAIEQTGYTPNMQAGSLASGRSRIVAVIVPNMSHSIFADTLHGLGQSLQAAGLQMLVASSDYSLEQEAQQIRAVLGWAPAALVLTGRHHHPAALEMIASACASGLPVLEM
ncbi:MAG: LacI family DNA-binding transcriptional regulator, partial [Brachymonas sp.]